MKLGFIELLTNSAVDAGDGSLVGDALNSMGEFLIVG